MSAPAFTCEAVGGSRLRVDWEDETRKFWLIAEMDGDRVAGLTGAIGRKRPTVFERPKMAPMPGVRSGIIYHDASAEPFAALVKAIGERIAAENLATAAMEEKDARIAARVAEAVRNKAALVRETFGDLLGEAPDDALADAYDRIQNGAF